MISTNTKKDEIMKKISDTFNSEDYDYTSLKGLYNIITVVLNSKAFVGK